MKNNTIKKIAVEGFDGTGKSTIAKWISSNYQFEYQKSPSGQFAQVRNWFDTTEISKHERLAFYTGDCIRISMLMESNSEKNMVLDRYFYSTLAYHNAKFPGSTKSIEKICQMLHKPDLVILVNASFKTIVDRIMERNENSANDSLFLKKELVDEIYAQYRKSINVPMVEINNDGSLDNAIEQIKLILK